MDGTHATNGWIGLAEAAQLLGISLDAMRRRVRRGEYQRRQVRTRHGLAWQVRLDGGAHPEPTVAPTDAPRVAPTVEPAATVDAAVGELVAYLRERDQARDQELERARRDAQAKAEAAALWMARAELLAAQLQQAQDRIRALEAPREPTPAEIVPGGPTDGLTVETAEGLAPPKRPWWRFW